MFCEMKPLSSGLKGAPKVVARIMLKMSPGPGEVLLPRLLGAAGC